MSPDPNSRKTREGPLFEGSLVLLISPIDELHSKKIIIIFLSTQSVDLAVLEESQGKDVVGLACEQLCQVVRILHNLVRSADIPTKARSQDLFKCLQKFYSVLEQLTKHVCSGVCLSVCVWG